MYQISKEFHFSAAHRLDGLPSDHQCARQHGHNYIVNVVLMSAVLDERGFVVDYGDLAPLKEYIDGTLDHRDLNDVLGFQTTAENIARHLFEWCLERWPETSAVSVSETPKTWATYSPARLPW